jgi:acetaldehyde dehydrogenase (acetylating)
VALVVGAPIATIPLLAAVIATVPVVSAEIVALATAAAGPATRSSGPRPVRTPICAHAIAAGGRRVRVTGSGPE